VATIVLVSTSPQRRELLAKLGVPFRVEAPGVDEELDARGGAAATARALARRKLSAYLTRAGIGAGDAGAHGNGAGGAGRRGTGHSGAKRGEKSRENDAEWALAADTVIACGRRIYGKATSRPEAIEMLASLAGRAHTVVTGIALYDPRSGTVLQIEESTNVRFARLSEDEINAYVDTEEWRGAAGAYRIQGRGELLVASVSGSYSNVVGLPIRALYVILKERGFPLLPQRENTFL
jgi:nucleoside triphosphate pyrophosphatase